MFEEPSDPRRSRARFAAAGVVVVILLVIGGAWLLRPRPAAVQPTPAPKTVAPPVAAAPLPETAPEAPTPAPVPARRAPRVKAAAPEAPAQPAIPALTLRVNSDVEGAEVFVDRVYLGKTPLETHDLKPGSHVLNVSAEGYESQALPVDVAEGATEVAVRFKVVRLDETVAVVHKHTIGSCQGRLVATPRGLRYETSNKDHAFDIPFSQIRSLDVDYLQKNLRLTRADGKTFNFTDRNPNADALFVFQKKVESARAKLASGVPPAEK